MSTRTLRDAIGYLRAKAAMLDDDDAREYEEAAQELERLSKQ